jgi:hypothetical protein
MAVAVVVGVQPARGAVMLHYLSTRARTTAITKTLWSECTMIPIHALWKRRDG